MTGAARVPVAVVGMGAMFPGAGDLDTYWRNLVAGVDAVTDLPPDIGLCAEDFPGGRGGFLGELAAVDAIGLGVMPAALAGTEPDQLLALHVATAALADVRGRPFADPERVGVILGRGGYLNAGVARLDQRVRLSRQLVASLRELMPDLDADALGRVRSAVLDALGPESPGAEIGLVPNLVASRIAHRLGFGGPAYTLDAACASSLIAVDHAVAELSGGRLDAVLAGGVHHSHDATLWGVFARLGALSPTARSRPFDRDADGLLIGEGTGVVVLKRLDDAHRDGDRVYAVIRGTGVASDGGGASLMHPATTGQVLALRRAWRAAGLDPAAPASIGLLEAHGTATPAGDAAELATLDTVFGPGDDAVIGSVKSMIGHAMPAAGIAGIIKAALAVHHGVQPPTLHCDNPHPSLKTTRFHPLGTAREWTCGGPRRAAVNAFGFGGISAHVILEQDRSPARATGPVAVREPTRVLRLAGRSPAELAELLTTPSAPGGGDVCRLSLVDPTEKKLAVARRVLAAGEAWRGRQDIWFSPRPLLRTSGHQLAFVYPGLEADFTPRIDDVAAHFDLVAPEISTDTVGRHGTSVVAVSRLLDSALRRLGIRPDLVAGHSIGEWTAMVAAGMYDEPQFDAVLAGFDPDAFRVPDLVFATVGCAAERIAPRLARSGIALSHDNSPHQCVVCGPGKEVERLLADLLEERVLGRVLPFRSGFHTPLLSPYLDQIEQRSARVPLRSPTTPIWSATTAAPFPEDPEQVRALFYRHLVDTVRFRPLIQHMFTAGAKVFVQVGPGHLSTLISDVLHGQDHLAIAANSVGHTGLGQLTRVAAALWAEGSSAGDELLGPAPKRSGGVVRLRLGAPVLSLGPDAARLIDRPGPVAAVESVPTSAATAELRALLRDTEDAALAVFAAARAQGPTAVKEPTAERGAAAVQGVVVEQEREMSLRAMPYLRDHSFFEVPAGWADDHDGFPVVPATELVRQMAEAAERTAPGSVAVAVHDARFQRWLAVEPPTTATFEVTAEGPGRCRVVVRGYARAVVELADRYPDAPAPWPLTEPDERRPLLTGAQMYGNRWMFHGPAYRGVTEISAIGARHVRGVITIPDAPGALLDNAGHLVGYWTLETFDRDSRTFPARFREIRQFAPAPPPGAVLTCVARVTEVTGTSVVADLQLVGADGRVWGQAVGWELRRFASDDRVRGLERDGGVAMLSEHHDEGWVAVHETWPDLASRELIARQYLARAEWEAYERQPPRERRRWLLGRIAAKDAVRHHLMTTGARPRVFAVELTIGDDGAGRSWIATGPGARSPAVPVSLAHHGVVGVALARPGSAGGIGVREVAAADGGEVLGRRERDLLDELGTAAEPAAVWSARFAAARQAVAAVEASGAAGAPRSEVTSACSDHLVVSTASARYLVRLAALDSGGRHHVVAWTYPDIHRTDAQENC
ncbi:beta-ketoacyl synthase N-terminal-like domain-containing protein [Umezawaea sp. Da 62-37]|uniref:beta-ketoacyl synthase N-terminal-like domain-containing protein n=1 Tax=Umezawaea sp. Da 62-37 TaxID=3075927 RepID=UPI0028F6E7F6|nr:beta-ketoacyl synthase N-terminal-like domain-containing protein [Umezawaea sp. Da 62-37]WNV86239.1 beta-ketoacyl synthase N-terminal-like domain-containing protein [Umezawaea sp. Da 62-37]